ncbi:PREDICTED: neurotactin [Ceratosolen solmsi marchali]|uniref:Neurotactin n=1 Tax=Ceratosolen solmsi marchali TaxID=326594 RepID=A0AAJ6YPP3_9HYME|nr:PREDICTED: neurotactin [Ceratosolen solmsi marchali]
MSQTDQQQPQEQDKSMDKKEIADEEREKMLNAENTKHTGAAPAPDLEAEDHKPKRKIPIGGIKMPGFCRSKSKEPCKEEDTKPAEAGDGEAPTKDGEMAPTDKAGGGGGTPVKETKEKEGRKGILEAIRLPLSSVFSRKKKESDTDLGTTGTAGLASVETLDDGTQVNNNAGAGGDDGMETVRLDVEAADGVLTKPHPLIVCLTAARRNVVVSAVTLLILLLVVIIICVACVGPRRIVAQPIKDGKVETQTSCGLVQGLLEDDAFVFRGIPYAVPPVNNRRWQPSEPLRKIEHCWNGTYLAHNSSEMCWQHNASNGINGVEDCLYLDVYTPQVLYDRPLPVVVMIGADTLSGPSPGIMIPSGKLARVREMVYVRPNFRLGVFGFLAVEPLSRAAHPMSSGNYGLSDIITVLQWVQLNIEHFGGDKKQVTLWGHRAGGTLVTALVGARRAKDLFARAWISSGSAIFPARDLRDSEKQNEAFLDYIRCKDASCMKKKNAEDVMELVPSSWHSTNAGLPDLKTVNSTKHEWLVKDDIIIQQHIGEIFSQKELPVKVVMGTTAQSGQLVKSLSYDRTVDPQEIRNIYSESLLESIVQADQVFAQYNSTVKGLHTIISDVRVVCPLMTVATMKSDIPFYISTFPRDVIADVDSDAAAILGFFPAKTPEQKRHLQAMQQLFNHFVWHGEVKEADSGKRILIVDQDILPRAGYENCKLWIDKAIVPAYARVD